MDLKAEKSKLRKFFKKQRSDLSAMDARKLSQKISENFIQNLFPKIYSQHCKKTFSLYLNSDKEVESNFIADYFIKNQIKFSYPKIIATNHELEFIISDEDQKFIASKFFPKIIEPREGTKILPDIIILPLVAFDSDLSRLGLGGGFFDRTIECLKKQKSEIITIGLAFEFQRSHQPLPIENSDQKLDFIVTEKTIFSRSYTAPNQTRKKT